MPTSADYGQARKQLAKLPDAQLAEGAQLNEALSLALGPCEPPYEADRLAYLVLILRRIPKLLQQCAPSFADTLDRNLTGASPASQLHAIILSALQNTHKTIQARGQDTMVASKNIALTLRSIFPDSAQQYFLSPLLDEPFRSKMVNKTDLNLVANLLEVTNSSILPQDLLQRVLKMVPMTDYPALRCRIVLSLLETRARSSQMSDESEDIEAILAPLLPLLQGSTEHGLVIHFSRYLFPPLFDRHPKAFHQLLAELQSPASLPSWILVASTGFDSTIHSIDSLPLSMLEVAASHPSTDVRLAALALFTKGNGAIDRSRAELIKRALLWSSNIPSSEFRMSFSSSMVSFFTSIRSLSAKARRVDPRTSKPTEPSITPEVIAPAQELLNWMLDEWILPSITFVTYTSSARILLALRIYHALATVFDKATTDGGAATEIHLNLFSQNRVDALIGCLASNFTEVRSRAEDVLRLAPSPLPKYPSIDSPSTQVLLESAYSCILGARNTDAEAGKALLRLVFEKLVRDVKKEEQSSAVAFTNDVINRLEAHIVASEVDLVKGMALQPLHGLLSAVREVISAVNFEDPSTAHLWQPVLVKARSLVDRTWAVCRVVLSATATQSTADHEIARARNALHNRGDADVDGGDDDAEDFGDGDHLILLSGCWRAVKEAGDLLSILIALPLRAKTRSKMPLPALWTDDEIRSSGDLFLTWLHEIRHRGTFSKLALAFNRIVEVVRPLELDSTSGLVGCCQRWLQIEIDTVQSGKVSTTRRSAALPYSILSIVATNVKLLDSALEQLFELARVSNEASTDDTKVHAFNSIRVVLLDARQAFIFERYFEQAVVLAVDAFASNNWNVRNVGLILLSTLLSRSFSNSKKQDAFGNRQTLAGRKTFHAWNAQFPLLLPFFAGLLTAEKAQLIETEHSALFPILIVLRNLRATADGRDVQSSLRPLVMSNLLSKDWQVREVASQAASSMVLPVDAVSTIIPVIQSASLKDQNGLMGHLMFVERIINDVLESQDAACLDLEAALLQQLPTLLERNNCPPTRAAFIRCVDAYGRLTGNWTSPICQITMNGAMSILTETARQPGSDLLDAAAGHLVMRPAVVDQAKVAVLLDSGISEDVRLLAIDAAESVQSRPIGAIATCEEESDAVRIRALEWLQRNGVAAEDVGALFHAAEQKRCIPLREAALPVLAHAVANSLDHAKTSHVLLLIEAAAREEESHESRFSAVAALAHFVSVIFPAQPTKPFYESYFKAHKSLYTLLIDDDDEVRAEASSIIGRGQIMVQGRAVDEWWQLATDHIAQSQGPERHMWIEWLWSIAVNQEEIDALAANLDITPREQVLFEPEPPNIFREPLLEVQRATSALRILGAAFTESTQSGRDTLQTCLSSGSRAEALSPIDRKREASLAVEARVSMVRAATAESMQ